jgi:hypothetical protein
MGTVIHGSDERPFQTYGKRAPVGSLPVHDTKKPRHFQRTDLKMQRFLRKISNTREWTWNNLGRWIAPRRGIFVNLLNKQ